MCHGCLVHFANTCPLCAMELHGSKDIYLKMTKLQLLLQQPCPKRYKTTKVNLEKLVLKFSIAIRFNLVQICPSVPSFEFALLFIPSFNVLSVYFYVFVVEVFTVLILLNIVALLLYGYLRCLCA